VDVSVIGAGRVGTALAVLLSRAGHDVVAVSGRSPSFCDSGMMTTELVPAIMGPNRSEAVQSNPRRNRPAIATPTVTRRKYTTASTVARPLWPKARTRSISIPP